MNPQRAFLARERAMDPTGFPFRLCGQWRGRPTTWVPWDEWDWDASPRCEFRTICQNELLIDLDMKDPVELHLNALAVQGILTKERIPHYIYDSGGKGYHFQVWMTADTTDPDLWYRIRHHTARWLLEGLMHKRMDIDGKVRWNIDRAKWNWNTPMKDGAFRGFGSVVRAIGGKKRSFRSLIGGIPSPFERRMRLRPDYPDVKFESWRVSDAIMEAAKKRPERPASAPLTLDTRDWMIPICVADLIERQFEGEHLEHQQRLAVVAYLYTHYKNKYGTITDEAYEKLHQIFSNDPDITAYQVRDNVNRLEQDPNRIPRCGHLRTIVNTEYCQLCRWVFGRMNLRPPTQQGKL